MFSELFIRKSVLVLIALVVGPVLLLGCSKSDQIEGSVKDVFGSPLSNVSVSIEKSAFKTKTNDSGAFGIDYAPGQFVVRFAKEGFTSYLLELNLHQKAHYPTGEVILYPIPSQEGMFFIDHQKKELVALPLNSSVQNHSAGIEKGTTRFVIVRNTDELMPDFPAGALQFIDTDPAHRVLNKVRTNDFAISEAKYWFGNETILYLDQPPESINRVGPEKIILRSLELGSGVYSWITYGRSNMGNKIPVSKKMSHTFSVNEGDEQKIAKVSHPPSATYKPPVVKSTPHTKSVVRQKKVAPTETITTKEAAVTQTHVTLDEPVATTIFTPKLKPRVPRGFIARQKAKAKVAIQNSFATMPCDTPSKFKNFALSRGQTTRVKICFDSDGIKIPFADRRRSNARVRLVNVQGQMRSRRNRGRPENFLVITRLNLLNKLILRPKNTVMRKGRVEYVVADVSLR